MENKIKGWANYGVLAHEKQTLFSFCNPMDATLSEEVEVEIPEGWEISQNEFKDYLLTSPEGKTYTADEIIGSWGDNPALMWYDGQQEHRVTLPWKDGQQEHRVTLPWKDGQQEHRVTLPWKEV